MTRLEEKSIKDLLTAIDFDISVHQRGVSPSYLCDATVTAVKELLRRLG